MLRVTEDAPLSGAVAASNPSILANRLEKIRCLVRSNFIFDGDQDWPKISIYRGGVFLCVRRETGRKSRMKEAYKERSSKPLWPRVLRRVLRGARRSVDSGTTGWDIEPCCPAPVDKNSRIYRVPDISEVGIVFGFRK